MDTNFLIVEWCDICSEEIVGTVVKTVIRVYAGRTRAEEDLALLQGSTEGRKFSIIEVPFVD